jgi:hypothetical protein
LPFQKSPEVPGRRAIARTKPGENRSSLQTTGPVATPTTRISRIRRIKAWRPGRTRDPPGLAAEDVDEHFECRLVFVDLDDLAREVGEGTFADPDGLAHFVVEASAALFGGRLFALFFDAQERLDLSASTAAKACPPWPMKLTMPGVLRTTYQESSSSRQRTKR